MKRTMTLLVLLFVCTGLLSWAHPAHGVVRLGSGDGSLLGGDLTDPEDNIVPNTDCAGDLPEAQLKPDNCGWINMKCWPANPPGEPAHQRHPYQSWQGSPASAIFWNKPETKKWYVGFKDGGYGGPTKAKPYMVALEFPKAVVLTHFTVSTSPDMPGRDPKSWALQGSHTGKDDDWTDIYVCDPHDRDASPFQEYPRSETSLFTSFTSADMAKAVRPEDLKKLEAKLKDKKIEKADFAQPEAYTWFRFATYSCFNPNTTEVADPDQPPGFSLGQLELFGKPE